MTDEVFSLGEWLSRLTFEDVKTFIFSVIVVFALIKVLEFLDGLGDWRDPVE